MKEREYLPIFFDSLADLLEEGLGITASLDTLEKDLHDHTLSEKITNIKEELGEGILLSEALSKNFNFLSDKYLNIIRIGEQSGLLVENLRQISSIMNENQYFIDKLNTILLYPISVIIINFSFMLLVLSQAVPVYKNAFLGIGVSLSKIPIIIRFIFLLHTIFIKYFYLSFPLTILFIITLILIVYSQKFIKFRNRCILRIPLLRDIYISNELKRISGILSRLISLNIPLNLSLNFINDGFDSEDISIIFGKSGKQIKEGEQLSDALNLTDENSLIPGVYLATLKSAETQGELKGVLESLRDYYEIKSFKLQKKMEKLLEPILIIVLGIFTGILAIGLYYPIIKISTMLGDW